VLAEAAALGQVDQQGLRQERLARAVGGPLELLVQRVMCSIRSFIQRSVVWRSLILDDLAMEMMAVESVTAMPVRISKGRTRPVPLGSTSVRKR
jgi:hypothetical protein